MYNMFYLPGSNSKYKFSENKKAGFLSGLWHGFIMPLSLIISFFNSDVSIYETNNIGTLYDLGFYITAAGIITIHIIL